MEGPDLFLRCAMDGDLDGVRHSIKSGVSVDCTDETKKTALMHASSNDQVVTISFTQYCKHDSPHSSTSSGT